MLNHSLSFYHMSVIQDRYCLFHRI